MHQAKYAAPLSLHDSEDDDDDYDDEPEFVKDSDDETSGSEKHDAEGDPDAAAAEADDDVDTDVRVFKPPLKPDQEARALAAERRRRVEANKDTRQQHQLVGAATAIMSVSDLLCNQLKPGKQVLSFTDLEKEVNSLETLAQKDSPGSFHKQPWKPSDKSFSSNTVLCPRLQRWRMVHQRRSQKKKRNDEIIPSPLFLFVITRLQCQFKSSA